MAEVITSDRDGPSGLAAIVRATSLGLGDMQVRADSGFAALHSPGNPGNVGAIIRTASAGGAPGVVLIGQSADPRTPRPSRRTWERCSRVPVASAASVGNSSSIGRRGAASQWRRLRVGPA